MLQKKYTRSYRVTPPFVSRPSFEIAELIFKYPNRTFHIREIARETKLSTTAVIRTIKELNKHNIITLEKTSITTNIRSDLESEKYTFYKRVFNLYRLEQYAILTAIKKAFKPELVVLFGSFAKGEDIEESDIDILVVTHRKKDTAVQEFMENQEKLFKRKINLHILPSLNKSLPEFKNAVANGIVLHGYLKVM